MTSVINARRAARAVARRAGGPTERMADASTPIRGPQPAVRRPLAAHGRRVARHEAILLQWLPMIGPGDILLPSRRQLLRLLGLGGISLAGDPFGVFRSRVSAGQPAASAPLFEEIAPSVSGISWVHDNAMSDNRYL